MSGGAEPGPGAEPGGRRFGGVHAVLFALFGRDGRLDRGAMRAQGEWVRAEGAHGLVVLGLATEVGKLDTHERRAVVEWAAEDAGRLPLAVTVAAATVAEARQSLRHAEAAGAAWAILQPPTAEADGLDAFARIAEGARVPLAIQNAPQYLGRALSAEDLATLRARALNVTHVKAEAPAADLAPLIERLGSEATVLTGRGGMEMTDCLRAGASGLIVAPDVLRGVLTCWDAWTAGDEAEAEAAYAAFLPAATFGMQSLDHLATYAKRVWGFRAGVVIHDRGPGLAPTEAGLRMARRWAGA